MASSWCRVREEDELDDELGTEGGVYDELETDEGKKGVREEDELEELEDGVNTREPWNEVRHAPSERDGGPNAAAPVGVVQIPPSLRYTSSPLAFMKLARVDAKGDSEPVAADPSASS